MDRCDAIKNGYSTRQLTAVRGVAEAQPHHDHVVQVAPACRRTGTHQQQSFHGRSCVKTMMVMMMMMMMMLMSWSSWP